MKKISILIIALILSCTMTGCIKNTPAGNDANTANDNKNAITQEQDGVFINLDNSFKPLKDWVIPSDISFFDEYCEYPVKISGNGILCNNNKSEIIISATGSEATINVDTSSLTIYCENFLGADIVDLDTTDSFYELALYSNGPSMDPTIDFIRYDGKNLIPIQWHSEEYDYSSSGIYGYSQANNDDILPTYGALWANGKGTVLTSFDNIGFTSKRIALRAIELDENSWVEKECEQPTLPYNFTISNDFDAFFTPRETPPEDYDDVEFMKEYNFENMSSFKKGQNITLIDYGPMGGYYAFYVDIDGEKGVLAFWVGD